MVSLAVLAAVLLAGLGNGALAAAPDRALGWRVKLGNGQATSFAELQADGTPRVIGVLLSAEALASLPAELSDGHHCVDRNGDGTIERPAECAGSHEFVIPLPDAVSQRDDVPFKWVLLNWNPHGHIPVGIYDVPHFDVHFYMRPIAEIFAIHDGTCGPEFVNCDAFGVAKTPLPPNLMAADYRDVDAVVPAMGNHFIDVSGPEFNNQPFRRSWIYGVYAGRVTFYEEMVTLETLLSKPDDCVAIKSPPAVAVAGWYPTQRCVRFEPDSNAYTVSMEAFVKRDVN
jgi:hypothetical protein